MDTNQAELAATVHFSWRSLQRKSRTKPTEEQVLLEVKHWKQRRRPPLRDEDIGDPIRNLAALRWIDVEPERRSPAI